MVYLIHFHTKYGHCQHYLGYADTPATFERRIQHHRNGNGANLMKIVTQAGIEWEVSRVWPEGDKNFERKLKNRKKSSQLCPICKANKNKILS